MAAAKSVTIRRPKPAGPARIASVPDYSVYEKYVPRMVEGVPDFDVMMYAYRNGLNVLIEGPTGPGKTMFSRAFAARGVQRVGDSDAKGLAFYAIPSNVGIDPAQLFGKYIPNEDAVDETNPKFNWVDGPVTDLVRNGGVLLINEVNFLPPRVATSIFSLLDGRREITLLDHKAEVIRAHTFEECWCGEKECGKTLLIVADMNPDYEGTLQLNRAFRNRFPVQVVWDYDPNVEVKLVESVSLRDLAEKVRKQHRAGSISTPVSTNMLMEFEKLVKDLGIDFAITNFTNHFAGDERQSVRGLFDVARENLERDYAPKQPVAVEGEWEFSNAEFDEEEWDFGSAKDGGLTYKGMKLDVDFVEELEGLIEIGDKVEAIKKVRSKKNASYREAKVVVDLIEDGM